MQTIDIDRTIQSGQVFLWQKIGNNWYGVDGDKVVRIKCDGCRAQEITNCPDSADNTGPALLRLDDDVQAIFASLSSDPLISELVRTYRGLRLLRQDPYQCMVSFVCASNTNIQMIRIMLSRLCAKFGAEVNVDGRKFHVFPSAEKIAKSSQAELRSCGLGYRAKAVQSLAKSITEGEFDIGSCNKLDYDSAKKMLMSLHGIGNKIADCILLFAFNKLEAFPIDVWIARTMVSGCGWSLPIKFGEKLTPSQYRVLSECARSHYGKYAGYGQQYLYYHVRQTAGKKW